MTAEIAEPATLITDYVLSIVAFALGVLLFRGRDRTSNKSTRLWSIAFLTAAAAAAAGGTYHGFVNYFSAPAHRLLWSLTVVLISASVVFATSGGLVQSNVTNGQKRWLHAGILLTLFGVAIQRSNLSLAAQFNHNDVYHCIQTVAICLLFKGAR